MKKIIILSIVLVSGLSFGLRAATVGSSGI